MTKKTYNLHFVLIRAIVIYLVAVLIIIFNPLFFDKLTIEDGFVEVISAISFLLSSLFFIGFLIKSRDIKKSNKRLFASFFTICWILFTFLCFGEEISWGQRIFGFELSEDLRVESYQKIESNFQNIQNETNLHNMGIVEKIGNRVILAGIQFMAGLFLPLLMLLKPVKKFFNKIYFPIPSLHYAFFIFGGICLVGTKLFYNPEPINGVYLYDRVNEFSEMMMGIGFFMYSLECFLYSNKVFKS